MAAAILITGRLVEATPYLLRLGRSDVETVQAISALLASVLAGQRLAAAEERNRIMVDAMPMCCVFWDEYGNQTDCNQEALALFELPSKEEFLKRFYKLSPEYQPNGSHSEETARENVLKAFLSGNLPILAMTANAAPEHWAESMNAGMNDHLTKPIDVTQLYNALKRWGDRDIECKW